MTLPCTWWSFLILSLLSSKSQPSLVSCLQSPFTLMTEPRLTQSLIISMSSLSTEIDTGKKKENTTDSACRTWRAQHMETAGTKESGAQALAGLDRRWSDSLHNELWDTQPLSDSPQENWQLAYVSQEGEKILLQETEEAKGKISMYSELPSTKSAINRPYLCPQGFHLAS